MGRAHEVRAASMAKMLQLNQSYIHVLERNYISLLRVVFLIQI